MRPAIEAKLPQQQTDKPKDDRANQTFMQAAPPDNTGVVQMFIEWLAGAGPTDRQFGPDAYMTKGLRTSPDIDTHRQRFVAQGGGLYDSRINGNNLRFSVTAEDGLIEAGLNMPRQFVGSFNLTIKDLPNGDALFVATNTTHLKSFLYQAPGVQPVDSSTMAPLSNKTQTYWWVEKGVI